MPKQTVEKIEVPKGKVDMENYCYFNDEFIPLKDAKISLMTHAFQYGTGIFEGIRCYWNEEDKTMYIFKMKEHYERLTNNSKIPMLELKHSIDEMCKLTVELVKKNKPTTDTYIRPNVFKSGTIIGPSLINKNGSNPTAFSIYTIPLGDYVDISKGLHVCVSSWTRLEDNALPPRGKIQGGYVNTALAKTEALLNGYDDSIVLSNDGHVSEGSAMNLFLIREGKLITSPVSDNILEGVTRSTIIELAKNEFGIETEVRKVDRTELYTCDEAFFCGTGAQVSPITKIDHRNVGSGKIGSVSKKLQDLYFDVVKGKHSKYKKWCTAVKY